MYEEVEIYLRLGRLRSPCLLPLPACLLLIWGGGLTAGQGGGGGVTGQIGQVEYQLMYYTKGKRALDMGVKEHLMYLYLCVLQYINTVFF
jgi:hypothetical protein